MLRIIEIRAYTYFIPLLMVSLLTLCAWMEPPRKLVKWLDREYPTAENIVWSKSDQIWQVGFELDEVRFVAQFDVGHTLMQTKSNIERSQLPVPVWHFYCDRFDETYLSDICIVNKKDGKYYEFTMKAPDKHYRVLFYGNGKFFGREKP